MMIRDDREMQQAQAKILVCQSLLANARQTLPPAQFEKEAARWLSEWGKLDDELRTYLSTLPEGAENRDPEEGQSAYASMEAEARAKNTAHVMSGQRVRLEFRLPDGELVQVYELRGARAWGILQTMAGQMPEKALPQAELESLKDRLDAIEAALVEARHMTEQMLGVEVDPDEE
jgi:hypothetical protein